MLWSAGGVQHVTIGPTRWSLAPSHLAWVPGGVAHDVSAARSADLVCAYVDPLRCPADRVAAAATVMHATPLVRELLLLLAAAEPDAAVREPAGELLLGLLRPAPVPAVALVDPADDRAAAVASALVARPDDRRDLDAWGRAVGASGRTLARLFVAETGLTFAQWRTRARIRASLDLLADGVPVARVAGRVGYASPSAFVAAFRRTTGRTPGAIGGDGG